MTGGKGDDDESRVLLQYRRPRDAGVFFENWIGSNYIERDALYTDSFKDGRNDEKPSTKAFIPHSSFRLASWIRRGAICGGLMLMPHPCTDVDEMWLHVQTFNILKLHVEFVARGEQFRRLSDKV